ncbi:hypothetical protein GT204_13860 [Streptomyces sp. SID4919]|uniref:hypothetical protein n=1 Tax=unclassified Streptomyces TaxID=2593676 RepID=UPI001182EFF7|nr:MULTISPECIES: hypothetical protein [unclassified Streptomyces]MYY09970.1 hypothetical protein [Streptomyces sp. SID4919]
MEHISTRQGGPEWLRTALLIPRHRTRPVVATPRGRALLDEAQLLFDQLERQLPHPANITPTLA